MKIKTLYTLWAFSVIFICAYFLWMIKNDSFKTYATEIGYRDKDLENRLGYNLEEYLKSKSITTFKFIGNEKDDKKILQRFQFEIQKVKKTGDFNQVVHLKFNTKTQYGDLIRAFQICKIEDCCTYIPDDYDFWVIPVCKKIKTKNPMPK